MSTEIELSIYVFLLAAFLGLELVHKVSPLLHTPLMSLTNAISAIAPNVPTDRRRSSGSK